MESARQLWSRQFAEHAEFAKEALPEEQHKISSVLDRLAKRWKKMGKAATYQRPMLLRLLDTTLRTNQEVIQIVEDRQCDPSLIKHMIEETEYFKSIYLYQDLTPEDEIQRFLQEHSENLAYVFCKLPQLYRSIQQEVPESIQKGLEKADTLSKVYKKPAPKNLRTLKIIWNQLYPIHLKILDTSLKWKLPPAFAADVRKKIRHERRETLWMHTRVQEL